MITVNNLLKSFYKTAFALSFVAASVSNADVVKWNYAFLPQGVGEDSDKKMNIINTTSVSGASDVTWSDSWTQGYWYTTDAEGNKTWSSSVPTDFSQVHFNMGDNASHRLEYALNITMKVNNGDSLTFGALTLGGALTGSDRGSYLNINTNNQRSSNFTILGDLVKSSNKSTGINYINEFRIGGDVNMSAGGNLAFAANYIEIGGDLKGSGNLYTDAYASTGSYANPTLLVKGVVNGVILYSKPNSTRTNYVQVGGVTGNGAVSREAPGGYGTANGVSLIVFANSGNYSASGNMTEKYWNNGWNDNAGKLHYVMNGTGSQTFTTDRAFLTGGIDVISGGMYFNFRQYDASYSYALSASETITPYRLGGASTTTLTHGNLRMGFGDAEAVSAGAAAEFGAAEGDSTYGPFRLTNVEYKSGTIKLRLSGADKYDSLELTSYELHSSKGGTTIVEGGTISKTADAGKVTFNFGDNLAWLIDAENDGVKIISWDVTKQAALTADDFVANTFTNTDGDQFKALFAVNDDGLYVKYVAVPEPATVAAIFGALALAFAAYRRRK